MRNVVLRVENIHKWFDSLHVLKEISFSVNEAETKVIFGPSGSGKSTLLRCINRTIQPDKGKIYLHQTEVTSPKTNINEIRAKIGMVFQHFNLFTHLKALDNVAIGLRVVKKMSKEEAREQAIDALRTVRMEKWIHHYPGQLSGGQKQRVGIARALAMKPDIILFDEPTSALDPELIGEVLAVMTDLSKENVTMVIVTHEMGFAKSVASDMIFIDEGRIVEQGSPNELFIAPKTGRVREFLSQINELYGLGMDVAGKQ